MDDQAVSDCLEAGRIASKVRNEAFEMVEEGLDLFDLAKHVDNHIIENGGQSAFPVNLSLNSIAAHFTPISKGEKLKVGDILKIDLGVTVNGYLADTATTTQVGVGENNPLIQASKLALDEALKHVKPGGPVSDVGNAVSSLIKSKGYKPIENLTGHLMKRNKLHAGLSVPNIPDASSETFPKEGLVAIEPFATDGPGHVVAGRDGNIYLFLKVPRFKDPSQRASAEYLKKTHPHLPFTPRWIDIPNFSSDMNVLLRKGAVRSYPILNESGGGMVSQHEHTVLFSEESTIITTQ